MPTTVDMSAAAETWKKMGPLLKNKNKGPFPSV